MLKCWIISWSTK